MIIIMQENCLQDQHNLTDWQSCERSHSLDFTLLAAPGQQVSMVCTALCEVVEDGPENLVDEGSWPGS